MMLRAFHCQRGNGFARFVSNLGANANARKTTDGSGLRKEKMIKLNDQGLPLPWELVAYTYSLRGGKYHRIKAYELVVSTQGRYGNPQITTICGLSSPKVRLGLTAWAKARNRKDDHCKRCFGRMNDEP